MLDESCGWQFCSSPASGPGLSWREVFVELPLSVSSLCDSRPGPSLWLFLSSHLWVSGHGVWEKSAEGDLLQSSLVWRNWQPVCLRLQGSSR